MTVNGVFGAGVFILFGVGLLSLSPTFAQGRAGTERQMPMYNTTTETVLQGTVEDVKTVSGMMGGRSMQGTHIILNSGQETIEVHLGPSAFLKEKKVEIAKGDVVKIIGSRVKIGEADALLARGIQKDGVAWTVRDATGRPLWGLGPRR